MLANYQIELDEQNFQSTLALSKETPLLIYFWANMVPESVELKQQLNAITTEYNGAFILACLDCEQQHMLAMQLGVQTLPALALFNNGQNVDYLAGSQTVASIREMLNRHLPNQDEIAFNAAIKLLQASKFNEALTQLKNLDSALNNLGEYKLALAECYIETKQFEQAQSILDTVLMQDQNAKYKSLLAKIELHKQAADSEEIRNLQQAFAESSNNAKLGLDLAVQLTQINQQEQALEILLKILQQDLDSANGNVKKTMMDILSALGQGNELANRYRRKLYALLY